MKNYAFYLIPFILISCCKADKRLKKQNEILISPIALFDSLIWQQYQYSEDANKTVYEWNWAYGVREALGIHDTDSLTVLCSNMEDYYGIYAESGITSEMTTASEVFAGTARFRMLNEYQALTEKAAGTPLSNEDGYYQDYALWEELAIEFGDWYKDKGNYRFMYLNDYYMNIANLRTEVLKEEQYIIWDRVSKLEQVVNVAPTNWEKKWMKEHPAIRRWYNHRMKMADKLHSQNHLQANLLSTLTYKQFTIYMKYEIETEQKYKYYEE